MCTPRLILGSSSPRRHALLREAGYAFTVVTPSEEAECGVCSSSGPARLVLDLALRKAADVVGRLAFGDDPFAEPWVVIACDTVAECGGEILGKPRDRDHAESMLRRLRGSVHRVYSGLCVWPAPTLSSDSAPALRGALSELWMDAFDDLELSAYLDSNLWEGKAGAFGLQDRPSWIHLQSGSPTNVVGLPMELLAEMLAEFGVQAAPTDKTSHG